MLMWTPKMWHMRAQRRHVVVTVKPLSKPAEEPKKTAELSLDDIPHKRHFPNSAKSHGLRAYFGYD